jgi:diguanylate cyclase (GGDEF)-like protein
VLIRLSGLLAGSLRSYDMAARIGGEEFCLILPGASSWRAQILTRRILTAFRAELFAAPSGDSFSVTFSAGIATLSSHGDHANAQELLSLADKGLYQAKSEGKNRIAVFRPSRPISENPALVRSVEKQFLFTGGT